MSQRSIRVDDWDMRHCLAKETRTEREGKNGAAVVTVKRGGIDYGFANEEMIKSRKAERINQTGDFGADKRRRCGIVVCRSAATT